MHEVSLCQSMRTIVERASEGRQVRTISVNIGALRQVVPDALSCAWAAVSRQAPNLVGSTLAMNLIAASFECRICAKITVLRDDVVFQCACGSRNVTVKSGEEFMVTSIDVRD